MADLLSAEPKSLKFEDRYVFEKSPQQKLKVSNQTAANVDWTAACGEDFGVMPRSGTLAAKASVDLDVEFHPFRLGETATNVIIESGRFQLLVRCDGKALNPLEVSPMTGIGFGDVEKGASSKAKIQVKNLSSVPFSVKLDLEPVEVRLAELEFFKIDPNSMTIEAGQTQEAEVTATAPPPGSSADAIVEVSLLKLYSRAGAKSVDLRIQCAAGKLRPAERTLDFGRVRVGESKELTVSVDNIGDTALTVDVSAVKPPFKADPLLLIVPPATACRSEFSSHPRTMKTPLPNRSA